MARRVRSYATRGITNPTHTAGGATGARLDTAGRKALATLGRRGGQQAAKRWSDPDAAEYQEAARAPLAKANQRRQWQGEALEAQVKTLILTTRVQTGEDPSTKEIATELGVSVQRIKQVRQALGMQAKRGRPKKG